MNHFIKQLLRLKINLSQFELKENNILMQAINWVDKINSSLNRLLVDRTRECSVKGNKKRE